MRQIGFPLSQAFIETTLANNAGMARLLVQLFKQRFDPASGDGGGEGGELCGVDRGGLRFGHGRHSP